MRAHQYRSIPKDAGKVTRIGHIGTTRDVVQCISIIRKNIGQKQYIDAMICEAFNHEIVVVAKLINIDRLIEIELAQVRFCHHAQFRPRAMHQHRIQVAKFTGDPPPFQFHSKSLGSNRMMSPQTAAFQIEWQDTSMRIQKIGQDSGLLWTSSSDHRHDSSATITRLC